LISVINIFYDLLVVFFLEIEGDNFYSQKFGNLDGFLSIAVCCAISCVRDIVLHESCYDIISLLFQKICSDGGINSS